MENEKNEKFSLMNVELDGNTFTSAKQYQLACKMAQALQSAQMLPKRYANNIGDCLIALDMAARLHAAPLQVMQNLYVVNGNPGWSGQFIISAINNSGRFKDLLEFELNGTGMDMSCYCHAETKSGKECVGTAVSMKMAKAEGWLDKNGSKWQTMPEQMIRYRAASFFGKLFIPDILMGIQSVDEVIDMGDQPEYEVDPKKQMPEQAQQEIEQHANRIPLEVKAEPEDDEEEPEEVEHIDESGQQSMLEPNY